MTGDAVGRAGAGVLDIINLSVRYRGQPPPLRAVRDVSLTLARGETLGLVGETGCGKSSMALAVMGYLGESGHDVDGTVHFRGRNVLTLDRRSLRRLRGSRMSMVFQDPLAALNPAMRVGKQVAETYWAHGQGTWHESFTQTLEVLDRVGLPDARNLAARYPHELSGGQQQRVVIAMALINNPDLLIMDEPTTGLDVTTEARILDLIQELQAEYDSAIMFVSHNLGVIAQVSNRVAVMYAGEVVEIGAAADVFYNPRHPYTAGLLNCVPRLDGVDVSRLASIPGRVAVGRDSVGCSFAPRCRLAVDLCRTDSPALFETDASTHRARCHFWQRVGAHAPIPEGLEDSERLEVSARAASSEARCRSSRTSSTPDPSIVLEVRDLRKQFASRGRRPTVRAVDGVSFTVERGETLALVGESGCGKTTLAHVVAGLLTPTEGKILFTGEDVSVMVEQRPQVARQRLQMVFQNPASSLNPHHEVGAIIGRGVEVLTGLRGDACKRRVRELLDSVQLNENYYRRYPGALSGGEKQRVSIARALAGDPYLVLCDEPTASLDVSVQAGILNMLKDIQANWHTSFVFISHDLGAVKYVADKIGVMYLGRLVEIGSASSVFRPPYHPYVEALLSAVPEPSPGKSRARIRLQGGVPITSEASPGCVFASRCPRHIGKICDEVTPELLDVGGGKFIACHLTARDVADAGRRLADGVSSGTSDMGNIRPQTRKTL
jgi:peptide/nickel transport system ATP-binding protein